MFMILDPEVVEIDIMLAEFAALCYLRARGYKTAHDVDAYRLRIVGRVQTIQNDLKTRKHAMSTPGLRPVVEQVCNEQVQNGALFTAHDITLEVRNRGHRAGHHEVRDAVHDYFQRGGLGVAYTRTTISVPSGGTPFLYHRLVDDPASYGNIRGVGMVPNPSVNTISVPDPSTILSEDEDGDDEDEDDLGGYSDLLSPASIFDPSYSLPGGASSVNTPLPSSVAGVAVSSSSTSLKSGKTGSKPGVTVNRPVDARNTLSIPVALIRKAKFNVGQTVYVSGQDGKVEVTNYPTSAPSCSTYTVDHNGQVRITQAALKRAGIGGTHYDVDGDESKIVVKPHQ